MAPRCSFAAPTPLFEEERYARFSTLVADRDDPSLLHWSGARATLAAHDYPVNALEVDPTKAFKQRFDGTESDFVKPGNLKFRETMEQVCWWRLTAEEVRAEADEFTSESARETMVQVALSYDLMAEDLERRLANRRSRDGLFVAQASAPEN